MKKLILLSCGAAGLISTSAIAETVGKAVGGVTGAAIGAGVGAGVGALKAPAKGVNSALTINSKLQECLSRYCSYIDSTFLPYHLTCE